MKALDLKHFKKVHSDHDKTVMQHPKGHTIEIHHAALEDHEKKALHALPFAKMVKQHLAEGGKVKRPEPGPISEDMAKKFAKGAHFAEGGEAKLAPADKGALYNAEHPNSPLAPSDMGEYAAAGNVELPAPSVKPSNNVQDAPGSQTEGGAGTLLSPPPPDSMAPPQNALESKSDIFGTEALGHGLEAGMKHAEQGLREQKQADILAGMHGAEAAQQGIKGLENSAKDYDAQLAKVQQETKNFQEDIKAQHIDPNHYFGSKSVGGQISTIIGLIIGGAPAAQFLEHSIDRDIKAQENNLQNKNNLLNANLKLYGNIKDAKDAARLQMMAVAQLKMQNAAELAKTPQAQANLTKGMAELEMKMAPIQQDLAARRALLEGQAQAGAVNPALAVRFAPGDESTKKAAVKELSEQENLNEVVKGSLRTFDEVSKLQNPSNRVLNPIQASAQINAKWGPMMDTITKQRAGRVTPQTVELFGQTKPSPFDTEETRKAKRVAFNRLLEEGERATPNLDALGVQIQKKMQDTKTKEKIPTIKRK